MRFYKTLFTIVLLLISLLTPFSFARGDSSEPNHVLSIGYIVKTNSEFSVLRLRDVQLAMDVILKRMTREHLPGYSFKSIILPDLNTTIRDFNADKIDILFLTSVQYFEIRDRFKFEPAFTINKKGKTGDHLVLLVQREKNIQTLEQLKNAKMIVEQGITGIVGLMWLDTLLLENGLPESSSYFKTIKRVNKTSQAVLPVFFEQADICIIPLYTYQAMIELNPQLEKKLKVHIKSPSFTFGLGGFRPGLDENVRNVIRDFSTMVSESYENKQFLMMLKVEGFSPFDAEHLTNIERMYEKHRVLKDKTYKRR